MKINYTDNTQIVVMVVVAIVVIRLFVIDLFDLNKPKPTSTNPPHAMTTVSPTPTPPPSLIPTPTPSPIPTIVPTPTPLPTYDKNLGNNYIASRESKKFKDVLNSAIDGFVTSSYLELDPAEITSTEDQYLQSVSSIFLKVKVNNLIWNSMNEDQQKDVVVSMTNSIRNAIGSGFPHVYINNGVRDVAEGSYSLFGEPKVTFK